MQGVKKRNGLAVILSSLLITAGVFAETETDNTKINKRDTAATELTADEQKSSESDMNITQRIRQEIVKNKKLSTYAKNVKIITIDGKVTLKGPVRSRTEVDSILKTARATAGEANITNEMTVEPK